MADGGACPERFGRSSPARERAGTSPENCSRDWLEVSLGVAVAVVSSSQGDKCVCCVGVGVLAGEETGKRR